MRNWAVFLLLTTIMNLLNSGTVLAQDLIVVEWRGTLSMPGFPIENVSYEVRRTEGELPNITMNYKESSYRFHVIKVTTGQLIFKWTPGDKPVECTLIRQETDGPYIGECPHPQGPEEGRALELTMVPPKAEE